MLDENYVFTGVCIITSSVALGALKGERKNHYFRFGASFTSSQAQGREEKENHNDTEEAPEEEEKVEVNQWPVDESRQAIGLVENNTAGWTFLLLWIPPN